MAILDAMFEFLNNQAMFTTSSTTIGATAKTLNWGAADLEMGAGEPIWLNIKVGATAYAGAGTADFRLLADTAAQGQDSSSLIVMASGPRSIGTLTANAWVLRAPLPVDVDPEQYLAVAVVCSGAMTAGTLHAWLDHGPQSSYDTQVTTSNI